MDKKLQDLIRRVVALQGSDNYDEIINLSTQIIELAKKYNIKSDAFNNRGNAYSEKGKHDRAIADYNQAIELNPKHADAFNNRGATYSKKGKHDQAIADYNQAIELNPNYTEAFNNRGATYNEKGEYDQAIADYNKVIELNPNYSDAFNNRGIAYRKKGEYDQAIADYNKAIELNPNYTEAFNNRGNAYSKKREYDKAIADYDKAIELNPKHADAFNGRGIAYSDKSEYDKALADFNQAIKLNPENKEAIHNRAVTLVLQHSITEQEKITKQYQEQLKQQQEDFDKKIQEDIKKKTQAYSTNILEAGGYKKREDEYKKEFKSKTAKRTVMLGVLGVLTFILYGGIAFMIAHYLGFCWLDDLLGECRTETAKLSGLFQFIPLTLIATLLLSPFVWIVRLINQDRDRLWALKEDAYNKGVLANLIDVSREIRNDIIKKFFDHHSNHSSTQIILNQTTPNNTQTSLVEHLKDSQPTEK